MDTTGLDMAALVRGLARIDDAGLLDDLKRDYALDCKGLPRDSATLHSAAKLYQTRLVAQTLEILIELPRAQGEAFVRGVLLPHPRRDAVISLVDEYTGRLSVEEKLQRERER